MSREAKLPKSAAQAKEFRGAHLGLEPKPAAARAFARSPLRCHPSAQSSAWHMAGPRQGSGTRKEGRGCPAAGKAMGSAILGWGPCQSPRLSQAESRPDSQEMGPQHGAAPGGDGPVPTRGGRGRLLPGDKHRCERLLPTADLLTGRRDPVFSTLSAERPHRWLKTGWGRLGSRPGDKSCQTRGGRCGGRALQVSYGSAPFLVNSSIFHRALWVMPHAWQVPRQQQK